MHNHSKGQWWVIAVGLLLGGLLQVAVAGEPLDRVRQTVDEVLRILDDDALRAPERTQERRSKLRQTVLQRFGFEEMAQRSLGPHWRPLKPEQRREFVALFSDLLERSYVSKIEGYGKGNKVLYTKETVDKDSYAMVQTQIVNSHNENYDVEYRLLQRDGSWQVYDVVIEGVSLVNNYRTQFNKIILQESYEALVKKLKLKRDQEDAVLGG
jgi:phospholipid transport system substrate-binding protein